MVKEYKHLDQNMNLRNKVNQETNQIKEFSNL